MRIASSFLGLASLFLFAACDTDRCASTECTVAGTFCSPDDGLCHCGGDTPPATLGPVCAGPAQLCELSTSTCIDVPPPVCGTGTRWEPGQQAFREATSEWALDGVLGVRISAVDFDGDGWTDLVVRNLPAGFDDFTAGGARHVWLMRNTGDGAFTDVTEASGLLTRRNGAGGRPVDVMAWADVDSDGDLDAYLGMTTNDGTVSMGETSEIMFQDSPGHFALGPDTNGVRFAEDVDVPAGASFVDYDLDGDVDLWVGQHNYTNTSGSLRFRQDRLWRNDGAGSFTDVTIEAGLETVDWNDIADLNAALAHSRAWSAAACDLNGDGLSELMVASYGRAPNHLWQAGREGDAVRFTNRSVASGYAFDEDQSWEDNQFARCYCAANRTAEGCADVPAPVLTCSPNWTHEQDRNAFRLGGNSGATICGDVDNDGDTDLLTTEIRHWWAGAGADGAELLVNSGEADVRFDRPGRASMGLIVPHADPTQWDEGLMTAAIFDFDLDGWPDVWLGGSDYPGNHGLLYHQDARLQFTEVPIAQGIDNHRSQGVTVADFDRDGDLDVVVGHSRARCGPPDDCYPTSQVRFFENLTSEMGNFVQLRLEGGAGMNRSAIGARIRVTADGVTQTHEIQGGHGHYGDPADLVQTFGLGAACEADVEVRWPDAALTTETFQLSAGHRYRLRPGSIPRGEDI